MLSGIGTLGTPQTPPDRQIGSEDPQVNGSRLLRESSQALTASKLRKNSPEWWRRGRRFACPKGCAEITLYVRTSAVWCWCGRSLIYEEPA